MLQKCYECQKKRKTPTKQDFLIWCATFHPNLRKHQKTAKKWVLLFQFFGFLKIFTLWLESSAPNQFVLITY